MTLAEVFNVYWNITEATITARDSNLQYLHRWEYGKGIVISNTMTRDIDKNRLTIIDTDINYNGRVLRNNIISGWAVDQKKFIPELLEAPIEYMRITNYNKGDHLNVDITLDLLTVWRLTNHEDADDETDAGTV